MGDNMFDAPVGPTHKVKNWKKSNLLVALAAIQMLALSGCVHFREDLNMNFLIGQPADGRGWFEYGYLNRAEEVRQLPNGNLEYVFDHTHKGDKEQCKYALEVDKSTRRFVGWRFLSNPSACYTVT
jgi:hypothetical protein